MAIPSPDAQPRQETAFSIGEWTVFPERNQLHRGSRVRRLEPKVMQVLLRLVTAGGATVSRQELLDEVWGDVVVVDRVINRSIWELRRVLGDDPRAPRYVETIPKQGYRLVAGVRPVLPEAAGRTERFRRGMVLALLTAAGLAALTIRHLSTDPAGSDGLSVAEVRPMTSAPGWEYDARLSPDGTLVAYAAATAGTGSWDLYVRNRKTGEIAQLTSELGAEGHPAWAPDGRRLAYYRYRRTGTELFVRVLGKPMAEEPGEGPMERSQGSVAADYPELDWSPDGRAIAFRQRLAIEGPFAIHARAVDDSLVRRITRPPTGWRGDGHPRYSPDGRWLAFVRSRVEGAEDLYLVALVGGREHRLTTDAAPILGLDWAGGDRLIFASRRSGVAEVWSLDLALPDSADDTVEAGSVRPLGLSGWRPGGPSWGAGGFAFVSWAGDVNLWRIAGGEAPARWVASTHWDLHPAISPDGTRIAFSSTRSGHYEIWMGGDQANGDARRLTRFEGPFTGTPRWSPDGDRLVFDSRPEGHADLFEIDPATGAQRRLTDHPADDLWGTWGLSGELYFASNRTGEWQIWVRDAGGAERQLTTAGGSAPQVGPEGRCLYHLRPLRRELWHTPIGDGCTSGLVVEDLGEAEAGSWQSTTRGVIVIRRGAAREPDRILLYSEAGGEPEVLWQTLDRIPWYDAALAAPRDGAWFVIGVEERPESDVYFATVAGTGR